MALGRGAKGTLVKGNPRFSLTAYAEKLISFFFLYQGLKFVCVQLFSCVRLFATPWILRGLFCLWGFSRQEYWSGLPFPPPGDLPNAGIEPRYPTLQVDSLPSEPLGKPKNTGVGSLSLLQGIFPTQESNQGLLHCRLILYQLSYPGSPHIFLYK